MPQHGSQPCCAWDKAAKDVRHVVDAQSDANKPIAMAATPANAMAHVCHPACQNGPEDNQEHAVLHDRCLGVSNGKHRQQGHPEIDRR